MARKFTEHKFRVNQVLLVLLSSLILGFIPQPSSPNLLPARQDGEPLHVLVTSTADSGEGTLRQALEQARPGTVIRFDPLVFPEAEPATIRLETGLPDLSTGRVTIDGQGAGVILDGSLLGFDPEQAFVDDVRLSFDDGPNLLENGDFNADSGLNHWHIWQMDALDNFRWNEVEGARAPGAFEWMGVSRQAPPMLIYHTMNSFNNASGDGKNFEEFPDASFLPLKDAENVTLRFWYRYGGVGGRIVFLTKDGKWINQWQWLPYVNYWDQAVIRFPVPDGVEQIGIALYFFPTKSTHGLLILSDHNVIQGLQIINFPGNGITIQGAHHNLIGGPHLRTETGCDGPCNLLSANMEAGVMIEGGGENIVQGNYLGVDYGGTYSLKNRYASVRIFDSSANQIGGRLSLGEGNLISGGSIGVEINQENKGTPAENNVVQGNLIGTDYLGGLSLQNDVGISLAGSGRTLIGGSDPDLRNIISGNGSGINLSRSAENNLIIGNYIGVDIHGLRRVPNWRGIEISDGASGTRIGGENPGEGNIISGNLDSGVRIDHTETTNNLLAGNWIGLGADGLKSISNKGNGIIINNAQGNQIGPYNRIVNNGNAGVRVYIDGEINRNTITQNSITNNQGRGIQILAAEIEIPTASEVIVSTRLAKGLAPAGAVVEIYQDSKDQGEIFLATVIADDKGRFHWAPPADTILSGNITVLVTDAAGSTGGFSRPAAPPNSFLKEIPGYVGPGQISLEPEVFLLNSGIAIIALLFFGVTATWFNESLENYSQEIALAMRKFLCKLRLVHREQEKQERLPHTAVTLLNWLVILSITALIQTFLDPDIRFDRIWLGQLATLILSGLFITGMQVISEWTLRHFSADHPKVRETEVSLMGMVLAALSVVFSRVVRFSPGVVLGTVDGLYCTPQLADPRQNGQRALAAKGVILGLTFCGWLLSPLFTQRPGVQALLITMFVIGVQYAFFELIPLQVLDGHALRCWNQWIWRLAFLISAFGFIYLCLNPDLGDLRALRENSLHTLGIMAGGLLLVTVLFKLFVQREVQSKKFMVSADWEANPENIIEQDH